MAEDSAGAGRPRDPGQVGAFVVDGMAFTLRPTPRATATLNEQAAGVLLIEAERHGASLHQFL